MKINILQDHNPLGSCKLHKSFTNVPPLRSIVLPIKSFNYNLAKYICKLSQPKILSTSPRTTLKNCFSLLHLRHTLILMEKFMNKVTELRWAFHWFLFLFLLFMGRYKRNWLTQKEVLSILFYKKCVDDIFCMFKTSEQAEKFLHFLKHQT